MWKPLALCARTRAQAKGVHPQVQQASNWVPSRDRRQTRARELLRLLCVQRQGSLLVTPPPPLAHCHQGQRQLHVLNIAAQALHPQFTPCPGSIYPGKCRWIRTPHHKSQHAAEQPRRRRGPSQRLILLRPRRLQRQLPPVQSAARQHRQQAPGEVNTMAPTLRQTAALPLLRRTIRRVRRGPPPPSKGALRRTSALGLQSPARGDRRPATPARPLAVAVVSLECPRMRGRRWRARLPTRLQR